jgi:hypothetical protein
VIDVRVREDYRVDRGRFKGEVLVPLVGFSPAPLEQTALQQQPLFIDLDEVLGTRDGAGCPMEMDLQNDSYWGI